MHASVIAPSLPDAVPALTITRLASHHVRAAFRSGVEPLDRYIHTRANQDVRRRVSACFVAVDSGDVVAGYFTLAMSAVLLSDLSQEHAKRLPRYPSVPATRLGRLAVDERWRGRGLGGALLWDAIERAARAEIAAYALVVDAKDDCAADFYRHYGFLALSDARTLFLPLASITVR